MSKNFIKKMFSDETELLDDHTQDIEIVGNEQQLESEVFSLTNDTNADNCTIVRLYVPASKNVENEIISAIKGNDLCIVNYAKLSTEESKLLHSKLQGAIQIIDGVSKRITPKTYLYGSKQYIVDSSLAEENS